MVSKGTSATEIRKYISKWSVEVSLENDGDVKIGMSVSCVIDIDKLNDSIYGRRNNFYNVNIKNSFTDKKYDVIMLSNMLEYCLSDLSVVRDNIDSLLKDNGVVVCSNMLTNGYIEHKVFSEVFNRVSLGTYRNNDYFGMEFPLGYVYKKDVNKK